MVEKKMTPQMFQQWIEDMIAAGYAEKDADCAELLGYDRKNLPRIKREGGGLRLSLACEALLNGLTPYGDPPKPKKRKRRSKGEGAGEDGQTDEGQTDEAQSGDDQAENGDRSEEAPEAAEKPKRARKAREE